MVKKTELEQKTITELTVLCMGQGFDPTGDKETLIARLLGKEKPKPKPEPEPVVEPVAELEAPETEE